MPTPKLSAIYRHALTRLTPHKEFDPDTEQTEFTCCAISQAAFDLTEPDLAKESPSVYPARYQNHLARTYYPLADVSYFNAFNEFPEGIKRQSARFLWLCMLATIAESEGV